MTCDPLELEIQPPYIGSAVSPTVDITETETAYTVTITDFRGDHSYTVEKTDQAIEDAEQAAANANNAATQATATANQAAQYARDTADQAAADAQATADAAAETANTAAASANTAAQSANSAASAANSAAQLATTAAGNADTKAALADSKATLANQAATNANNATQAAQSATADAQTATQAANTAAGIANTSAANADAKAALANTAAANADTATQAANTATTAATNAATAANNAADVAIEAAEDMPKLVGTVDSVQTVNDAWETTLEGAMVYGKSVQDGTPTPSNPVEVQVVGGRNLLDITQVAYTAVASYTVADNALAVSATGASGWSYARIDVPITGGSHTISFAADNTSYMVGIEWYSGSTKVGGHDVKTGVNAYTFTVPANCDSLRLYFYSRATSTGSVGDSITYSSVQLEAGTTATPYTSYGCIGIQVGETITPIDLQGHTLAGLPDGTRDVLCVDSVGRVTLTQNVGNTTINDHTWAAMSNPLSTRYIWRTTDKPTSANMTSAGALPPFMSDSFYRVNNASTWQPGQISWANTAADHNNIVVIVDPDINTVELLKQTYGNVPLYYPIETQTIDLGTITPPDIAPGDTLAIYASLDPEWAIEYEQDPNIVVTALQSSIAPVEGNTASANYSVGSYLIHANQLYRVTRAIATGESITPGTNVTQTTVMAEVVRLTA